MQAYDNIMKRLNKNCGNCVYFGRMKHMKGNSGLCDCYDCRTDVDCGKNCPDWKGIKYKRKRRNYMLQSNNERSPPSS